MLVGIALVPAVTSIVIAVLVNRLQERRGRLGYIEHDLTERLERIERALEARDGPP
jgi:hypothetical protein